MSKERGDGEDFGAAEYKETEKSSSGLIRPLSTHIMEDSHTPYLPDEVTKSERFQNEIESRRQLLSLLTEIARKAPDVTTPIHNLVESGDVLLTESDELYTLLEDFVKSEDYNRRLILYLPFEYLPVGPAISETASQFMQTYLEAWKGLLNEGDLRANFVDGDVLEPELATSEPEVVRKAAHLIPDLVDRGLVTSAAVLDILQASQDPILVNSILDTLPVLADMKLLSQEDWRRILLSDNHALKEAARRTREPFYTKVSAEEVAPIGDGESWVRQLFINYRNQLTDAWARLAEPGSEASAFEQGRWRWEVQEQENQAIATAATSLSQSVRAKQVSVGDIISFDYAEHPDLLRVAITGVGMAAEELMKVDPVAAGQVVEEFSPFADIAWSSAPVEVRDALYSLWSHWHALNLVGDEQLKRHNLSIPKLDSQLTADETLGMLPKPEQLDEVINTFQKDPYLASSVYPTLLFFGSKLKGYANFGADLDAAVFIKPEVSWDQRLELKAQLQKVMEANAMDAKLAEFWLELSDRGLKIRETPDQDNLVAGSNWVHLLLSGAWYGSKEGMPELVQNLLEYYASEGAQAATNRKRWLGEIEREVLQYRLMHRGYSRFYPRRGGIQTPHSHLIDSQSNFYDPGYRRLATQLFVSKVFLPAGENIK